MRFAGIARTVFGLICVSLVLSPQIHGQDEAAELPDVGWEDAFMADVDYFVEKNNISDDTVELVIELLENRKLPDEPEKASEYVTDLLLYAEIALRKGTPEPLLKLLLTRKIQLSSAEGEVSAHERAGQRRLRGNQTTCVECETETESVDVLEARKRRRGGG